MEQAPFYFGQKVVCVNDGKIEGQENNQNEALKKDQLYSIESVFKGKRRINRHLWLCKLVGVEVVLEKGLVFEGFCCSRFAPIQDQYEDLTREIAEGLKETKETPDKILIPEKINN